MNFRMRCVARMAAALLWSASTASAETYTVSTYLSSAAINATAKGKRMLFTGGYANDGTCKMTAQWNIYSQPFLPAPVYYYGGHTGTLDTSDIIHAATVQYEEPLGVFHTKLATPTLVP